MPLRVLHVIGNLGQGGVQRYLLSYLEHMDRKKVVFDFVVQTDEVGCLEERVKKLGSEVYHLPSSIEDRKGFERSFREVMARGEYKVVEAHQNHRCLFPLSLAKSCGATVRIAHSHSSYPASSIFTRVYRILFKNRIGRVATHMWGCSKSANVWLYGERLAAFAEVIPNAIDARRFEFDASKRLRVRTELGIEGPCIGHVGAGGDAKNYPFILELFKETLKREPSARLLLIGCSPESQGGKVASLVKGLGLVGKVIMTGAVDDPESYICAMDCFVLPSHFEGMPIVLVEAQANGLSPIVAESVTREVDVTGRVLYLPTGPGDTASWAEAVLAHCFEPRFTNVDAIGKAGYEIRDAARVLQKRYLRAAEEAR